ncbi:MAG: hypothetical protein Q9187_004003 [Circinaria calcarea]
MSEKKRKQRHEEGERPRKKRVTESTSQTVNFSILQNVGDWAPVIATTPGLNVPTNVPLEVYTKPRDDHHTGAGRTAISTTELLLHTSAHPKIDYTAREEEYSGADSLLKHYLGVYDPKTGDLQLVQARKLVVRGVLRSETTVNGTEDEAAPLNKLSARSVLGQAFGTKKSQKAIRAITENAITSPSKPTQNRSLDPAASAVIESMSQSSTTIPSREELQAVVDEGKPRPRPNLDAETPADVYKVEDLVGLDALRVLSVRNWQEAVRKGEDVKTSSRFVSRRLVRIVQTEDVMRLKTLRFLLLLLDWNAALKPGSKGGKKFPGNEAIGKAVGPEIGEGTLEGVRKRFAPEMTLNKWAIDNLMTHICALALAVDNYEIDTYDLREDLKLEPKIISQYFRELGCRYGTPTESELARLNLSKGQRLAHGIAKLRLPLEFPKARVMVPKRR